MKVPISELDATFDKVADGDPSRPVRLRFYRDDVLLFEQYVHPMMGDPYFDPWVLRDATAVSVDQE